MTQDATFIEATLDLVHTVTNAIRRGQITGMIAQTINISLNIIGENTPTKPLELHRVPVRFAVPRNFNLKTGQHLMATISIRGDMGTKVPVEFDNIAGSPVGDPTGDATVTCSDTTIATVSMDADGHSVDIFPVQPAVEGKAFTLTYVDGEITFSSDFEITPDLVATQGHFVDSAMTNIPLPTGAPTA